MFFLVAGIVPGSRSVGSLDFSVCPSCGAYTRIEILQTYQRVSLFFIPLVKLDKKYIARCTRCGAVFDVDGQKARAFDRGEGGLTADDIKPLSFVELPLACPECGRRAAKRYPYCPFCGHKLEE